MRRGRIFVKGDAGYRAGIHMKADEGTVPVIVCGGKARCSTCRIRVVGDLTALPEASRRERFVLDRVGASVEARIGARTRRFRVVGQPVLPEFGDAAQLGTGSLMTLEGLHRGAGGWGNRRRRRICRRLPPAKLAAAPMSPRRANVVCHGVF